MTPALLQPAKVMCSGPACPTGYTKCGPYCVKNTIKGAFGAEPSPFMPNCLNVLSNFPGCIPVSAARRPCLAAGAAPHFRPAAR